MVREDPEITRQRNQLRDTMHQQGCRLEQIVTAMTHHFEDRPRPAWRHAHGWTQHEVADLYNELLDDSEASMNSNRISAFERWPINGTGTKPTVPTLGVLAKIYTTKVSNLIDRHDRPHMTNAELITCATLDSGIIPHQLPSIIPHFVGRTHELNILNTQLDRATGGGDSGPVVITSIGGTAGIGKTTLALYWARTHINHFPDGQLYVDLRGFSPSGAPVTPQDAVRGFLDAFQVPVDKIPATLDTQAALYRTLVEGRRLVIVLDNARDADQVWPLLPGSPRCVVLVTSRQQLGSLITRKHATYITLDFLAPTEAHTLLTDLLSPKRIQTEPEAVDELIQRCVGLPIALSIAAARILLEPHLPLSVLVGQLREQRQRLDALSTGRGSPETDIRAVFSWSYSALSSGAARLFRLLGLHPGPDIDTLAAASLAGLPEPDTRNLLTELTRADLVKQHIPGRYQFHDLLRAYATEQATTEEPEQQRRAVIHRMLDYYLHTSFAAEQHLNPERESITLHAPQPGTILYQIADRKQALEWFTAEHTTLLAVIDHASIHGFHTHAWQLPWTLANFLHWQGHWHDYVATQQTAISAANCLGDRAIQALVRHYLGHAHAILGRYVEARAHFQQALTLYQQLGDRTEQAHTHISLGWICGEQGQYTDALTHARHAFDFYRATVYRIGEARALNDLGWYLARLGNYQQALTVCQQALNLQRELGHHHGEADTLDSLGYAHHHLGQHTEAITHYQQSIALYRELGGHYGEADTLVHLGDTYHAIGNLTAARETWQQALVILGQLGHSDADTLRTKLDTLATDPDTDTNHARQQ